MEIDLGPFKYRIGRLTPFQQFHVARRLAPAFTALGTAGIAMAKKAAMQPPPADPAGGDDDADADIITIIGPVAEAISKMSDADANYVLNNCLRAVSRQSGVGWAPIQGADQTLQFTDIDMGQMIRLTVAVIQENLGNFLPGPPRNDSPASGPASASS